MSGGAVGPRVAGRHTPGDGRATRADGLSQLTLPSMIDRRFGAPTLFCRAARCCAATRLPPRANAVLRAAGVAAVQGYSATTVQAGHGRALARARRAHVCWRVCYTAWGLGMDRSGECGRARRARPGSVRFRRPTRVSRGLGVKFRCERNLPEKTSARARPVDKIGDRQLIGAAWDADSRNRGPSL